MVTPEPGTELVLKTDPIAEGVHFLADDAPEDVAWKALAVNVSDLAAKGAKPIGYLMALSFPEAPDAGLDGAVCRWAARGPGAVRLPSDRRRHRSPAGPAHHHDYGCRLGAGGTHGAARDGEGRATRCSCRAHWATPRWALPCAGGRSWRRPGVSRRTRRTHLRRRYLRPEPRLALGPVLRAHASAAMDISDGLAKDLGRMCSASGCGASVRFADLPLSAAGARAVAADPGLRQRIVAGGDDYEILAAVPVGEASAFQVAAAQAGVSVTRIGSVRAGAGVVIEAPDGQPMTLERTGWDHF